ncbi:MAG: hypothetical protein Q8R82_03805 [Hyphomonadaceae bacterium]|nr:hypothetical protein [Hyphomonadaceae bacterium]
MHFLKLGMTAIATGVLANLTMSPAIAQTTPPPLTKQMIGPLNDAQKAIVAKDWATAKTKLDAASAQAKTPNDQVALNQLRIVMQSETKDNAGLAASLESLLASGLITPEQTKQYRGVLAKAYGDAGDTAKSLAAFRVYIDAYGGTAEQYLALSADAAKTKDWPNTVTYAKKSVDSAKAAGAKPTDTAYLLQMRAHKETNDMTAYYAVEEALVADYPKEDYWKELIAYRTQDAPNYGGAARLDLFRAMQAAGITLTVNEKRTAIQEALKRGLPAEALALAEPAIASGELGSAPEDQDYVKKAKAAIASDKAGLEKEAADALKKGNAISIANIGEAMMSYGDNAKAIEMISKGIEIGIADPADLDIAKLHLGIAQYRSGQKEEARTTWSTIKADNGAAALAQNWTLISKLK